MFLRQFSPDVTLIPKWRVALSDAQRKELADSDVVVLEGRVERLAATASAIAVQMRDEPVARRFDILYPAFGSRPRPADDGGGDDARPRGLAQQAGRGAVAPGTVGTGPRPDRQSTRLNS